MEELKKQLIKKIKERNFTVAVIGLGYVGLPLLLAFSKKGFHDQRGSKL